MTELIGRVEEALEQGSALARVTITHAVEPAAAAGRVDVLVLGDGFAGLSPGNRHALVWGWLGALDGRDRALVASLLILTPEELERLLQTPPSSGVILGFADRGSRRARTHAR